MMPAVLLPLRKYCNTAKLTRLSSLTPPKTGVEVA
jgi:hypothetical protein